MRCAPSAHATDLIGPLPGDQIAVCTDPNGEPFFAVARAGETTTIRFHGQCDLVVGRAFDEVMVTVADGRLAVAAEMVAGAGIATILCLAGKLVLHASTFSLGPSGAEAAVAVIGRSQSGKSTFTALACAAGAHFVGDDVLRVDNVTGSPVAREGHGEIRLRRPIAHDVLACFPSATLSRTVADERLALTLERRDAVPLQAFVLPIRTDGADFPRIERCGPVESLLAIARSSGMAGWRAAHQLVSQHRGAEYLAARVPVFRLLMPESSRPDLSMVRRGLDLLASEMRVSL